MMPAREAGPVQNGEMEVGAPSPKRKPWHDSLRLSTSALPSSLLAAPVAWVILHSPHSPNTSPRGSAKEGLGERLHWREREEGDGGRGWVAGGRRKGESKILKKSGEEQEGEKGKGTWGRGS